MILKRDKLPALNIPLLKSNKNRAKSNLILETNFTSNNCLTWKENLVKYLLETVRKTV